MIDYNRRFGRRSKSAINAHRDLSEDISLERVLCIKEKRKISKHLTLHYKNKIYQIQAKNKRNRLPGKMAEILETEIDVLIEFEGENLEYTLFEDQPYEDTIMDRKRIQAFLDRKKPMTVIERSRKKKSVNF